jgi:hypothetical protein
MHVISVAKVQLAAHWFYADDFDMQIETAGYLGFFDLSDQRTRRPREENEK